MKEARTNRLVGETSPYLLQHAHNPVDWYPWGDEALARARREDKPILLSVGYSACHWCHVMERESFENDSIAGLMNERFVCIKVDREERPDIDYVYMGAVQAMTGGGGWPLTVFLTPEGEPFYGGTYFPPEARHGLPGFPQVLMAASEAYRTRRSQVLGVAQELVSRLRQNQDERSEPESLAPGILEVAYQVLQRSFDGANGGFGPQPKFPQAPVLEFLLHYHHRTGEARSLRMVEVTLEKMALGGIYDHIGGGFHRYATDGQWMIPHFEKMLYDNALLSRVYLHAYQVTGKAAYRRIAEETLDYVLREMTDPAGGFYSSQDADVDGEEGRYYLWTPADVAAVLGEEDGALVGRYFGVASGAGFEGGSILHISADSASLAAGMGLDPAGVDSVVAGAKARLLEARERRTKPGRDDKIVACWNGLTLQALSEAASVLGREDYRTAAVANARFVTGHMIKSGDLMHSHRDGRSTIPGYLEDYAATIRGLICLHEATLEQRWLEVAFGLVGKMVREFSDEKNPGLLYDTTARQSTLFARPRDTSDSVKPCGGSAAADVLLRMTRLSDDSSHERLAAAMLALVRDQMVSHPLASGNWLCALDFYLADPEEAVVVGHRGDPGMEALLAALSDRYMPNRVVAGIRAGGPNLPLLDNLAEGRMPDECRPAVCLCRRRTCYPPVYDPEQLRRLLNG